MRISTDPEDSSAYKTWVDAYAKHKLIEVFVDGVIVDDPISADTEAGEVVVVLREEDGTFSHDGGEQPRQRLVGVVEIRFDGVPQ